MLRLSKPILIFAQSGRFLAQSATQAGYRVWVADCFGDQDTLDSSERWYPLPPFYELQTQQALSLLNQVSNGEECLLICGSGIEQHYAMLSQLPANINYIGNSQQTLNLVKTPSLFFDLLTRLGLPYPETFLSRPHENSDTYLAKSKSGFGGLHIKTITNETLSDEYYYQRYISGQAGSVLFLTNGDQTQLISVNKQSSIPGSFCLTSIETPYEIQAVHKAILIDAINTLSYHCKLVGVNSLDFIISDKNELFILEINPRLSASAELYHDISLLFQHHLSACIEKKLLPIPLSHYQQSSLYYLFSSCELTIPSAMQWPECCNDIPCAGTQLKKQSPICTVIINSLSGEQAQTNYEKIKASINIQLDT